MRRFPVSLVMTRAIREYAQETEWRSDSNRRAEFERQSSRLDGLALMKEEVGIHG